MFIRKLPSFSGSSLFRRNVRNFYSKIRLEMTDNNVVLEQATKCTYDIAYDRIGSGSKGLILLPGSIGTMRTDFQPQIDALPTLLPDYTIIGWDPPGYGDSRPPERTFPAGFYHRDAYLADALMQKMDFQQYSIIGWSDGGTTGLIMASSYPEAVNKLAIWGSAPVLSRHDVDVSESIRDVSTWSRQRRELYESVYGIEYLPQIWSKYVDGIRNLYDSNAGRMSSEELLRIEAKTLILHGAKDPLITDQQVALLRKIIKSTEYYEFPEGRHNIHLQYADEFNRIVSEFFQKDDHAPPTRTDIKPSPSSKCSKSV